MTKPTTAQLNAAYDQFNFWYDKAKKLDEDSAKEEERLNMPVVAEVVAREQPEHLREYFMERIRYYREQSIQLPRASDPRYIEMTEQNAKK